MHFLKAAKEMCEAVILATCVLIPKGLAVDKQPCAQPQSVVDPRYSPGQVWSYRTRPGENSSTVTILHVENLPKLGVIIHVRIDDIQLRNCTGGPAPTTIEHAPFTKAAIDKSVIRELKTISPIPEFDEGDADWLAHCGGVYTITLAEMLDVDDVTFNAQFGCPTKSSSIVAPPGKSILGSFARR